MMKAKAGESTRGILKKNRPWPKSNGSLASRLHRVDPLITLLTTVQSGAVPVSSLLAGNSYGRLDIIELGLCSSPLGLDCVALPRITNMHFEYQFDTL